MERLSSVALSKSVATVLNQLDSRSPESTEESRVDLNKRFR